MTKNPVIIKTQDWSKGPINDRKKAEEAKTKGNSPTFLESGAMVDKRKKKALEAKRKAQKASEKKATDKAREYKGSEGTKKEKEYYKWLERDYNRQEKAKRVGRILAGKGKK